jgi:hypothetical protein
LHKITACGSLSASATIRTYTNLQNHRLVIASSAPTEAADPPPWLKQPESERIFFFLWDQNGHRENIYTSLHIV